MSETYDAALEIREAIRDLRDELRAAVDLLRDMQAELIALVEIVAAKAR